MFFIHIHKVKGETFMPEGIAKGTCEKYIVNPNLASHVAIFILGWVRWTTAGQQRMRKGKLVSGPGTPPLLAERVPKSPMAGRRKLELLESAPSATRAKRQNST